jgi:hypothetical protein
MWELIRTEYPVLVAAFFVFVLPAFLAIGIGAFLFSRLPPDAKRRSAWNA